MLLNFRQGIIRHQIDIAGTSTFVKKNGSDPQFVDLQCYQGPVTFTATHFGANYLIEENKSILKAWGPMPQTGETQYLYWDISLLNAQVTHGYTILPPYTNSFAPPDPELDQHWFDTSVNCMKVWNGTKWLPKIRLFAATYDNNAVLIPRPRGSQVNLTDIEIKAGNIILGQNEYPLRDYDGTFITTESNLIVSGASNENVKFDAALQFAQADEFIPKYYLVSTTSGQHIKAASSLDKTNQVHGIIQKELMTGEVGTVISHGLVKNEQWDWSSSIRKPLFCGPHGEVTLDRPLEGIIQQIGYVFDTNAIYMNIMNPTKL
jgi:hypothetical protein